MKKFIVPCLVVFGIMASGCQKDLPEDKTTDLQDVTFNIGQAEKGLKDDYADCALDADYALMILDGDNQNPVRVPVFYLGDRLYTQALKMSVGSYVLNEFTLFQDGGTPEDYTDDTMLSAVPHKDSKYGSLVSYPVDFEFTISAFTKSEIPISILCYEPAEYSDFGFTWLRIEENIIKEGLFFGDFCTEDFAYYLGSDYGDYPKFDMPAIFEVVLYLYNYDTGEYEFFNSWHNNTDEYIAEEQTASVPPLSIGYIDRPDLLDHYKVEINVFQWVALDANGDDVHDFVYYHDQTWYFTDDMSIMYADQSYIGSQDPSGIESVGPGQDGVYDFITGPCTVAEWDFEIEDPDEGDGESSETAFAYTEDANGHCFSEWGIPRWGWTNEISKNIGVTTLAIWAGAGQCETSKGTLVGNLIVAVSEDEATITYDMIDGEFFLEQVHLYVGESELVPKGNGETVAPGQYPMINDQLDNVDNYTFTVDLSEIQGDSFWLIAHSVVTGMY
jgi:hypothetical protein